MPDANQTLDAIYLEMRWRCLTLAADLDRLERSTGGKAALQSDPRMIKLRTALAALLDEQGDRARRVQMIFSDLTPPVEYKKK